MQSGLSAQDLFCMAAIEGKRRIFGIRDAFSGISKEYRSTHIYEVRMQLLDRGVAAMDFDGKLLLKDEYRTLVNDCCDCQMCLTLEVHRKDSTHLTYLFWKNGRSIRMAEAVGERYLFSFTDGFTARAIVESELPSALGRSGTTAVIPFLTLKKAKNVATKGNAEEALRLLRQNGADMQTAFVIEDGFREKADYLRVVCMDTSTDTGSTEERVCLSSRGITLLADQTVLNYRTCGRFVTANQETVRSSFKALLDRFFEA